MNKKYLEIEHYLNKLNKRLENLKKETTYNKLNEELKKLDFEDITEPFADVLTYKKNDEEIYIYIDYKENTDTNKIKIEKIEVENIPAQDTREIPDYYYIFKYYNCAKVELIAKFYNLEYATDLLDYLETITKEDNINFTIEDDKNILKEI